VAAHGHAPGGDRLAQRQRAEELAGLGIVAAIEADASPEAVGEAEQTRIEHGRQT
jgi:hypothetical protein